MINKKIGNDTEKTFIDLLADKGFWVHLFAYKPEGQPCDVVAIRNGNAWLIDVKHCSAKSFPFEDIRPNQKNCFKLAMSKGNLGCGFAIYFEQEQKWKWLFYIAYEQFEKLGRKSIRFEELPDLDEIIH